MINATIYTDTIAANQTLQKLVSGSFFKILSATGSLNFRSPTAQLQALVSGQGIEKQAFDRIELQDASGASNTVRYIIASEGFLDGIQGSIQVSQNAVTKSGSYANTLNTVSSAGGSLLAANAARQYLLIQKKEARGNL